MKNLAGLKRAIQPGVRLVAVAHWQEKLIGTVRTITHIQGNGYWYTIEGDHRRMWSNFGRAGDFSFPSEDSYRYEKDGRGWTLKILSTEASGHVNTVDALVNPPIFDYANQAWIVEGKYVRCGHPETMACGCYGRAHAGEVAPAEVSQ